MELEKEYLEQLKAFEADCERVCNLYHIDRQTLGDFMTFANYVRCLGDKIGEMCRKGSTSRLALDAGMMAQMARTMFVLLYENLVSSGKFNRGEFNLLIDHLNREMGSNEPGQEPGLYPVHYKARDMYKLLNRFIAARVAILRSLESGNTTNPQAH